MPNTIAWSVTPRLHTSASFASYVLAPHTSGALYVGVPGAPFVIVDVRSLCGGNQGVIREQSGGNHAAIMGDQRLLLVGHHSRYAEVSENRAAVLGDEDVVRLEVEVNNVLLVMMAGLMS